MTVWSVLVISAAAQNTAAVSPRNDAAHARAAGDLAPSASARAPAGRDGPASRSGNTIRGDARLSHLPGRAIHCVLRRRSSAAYYIFGATATFNDLVTYYRTQLKDKGNLVFQEPPTHMFEIGKFNSDTMAFPPGVDDQGLDVGAGPRDIRTRSRPLSRRGSHHSS